MLQVQHLDIVGLSWHKTTLSGTKTVQLNQTRIVQDIIEWNETNGKGGRKSLLLIEEWGVHPVSKRRRS